MNRTDTNYFTRRARYCRYHPTPFEFPDRLPGTQELSGQIYVDHQIPLLQCHFIKGGILLNSGIVD
jgi:hypothetical protein